MQKVSYPKMLPLHVDEGSGEWILDKVCVSSAQHEQGRERLVPTLTTLDFFSLTPTSRSEAGPARGGSSQ